MHKNYFGQSNAKSLKWRKPQTQAHFKELSNSGSFSGGTQAKKACIIDHLDQISFLLIDCIL